MGIEGDAAKPQGASWSAVQHLLWGNQPHEEATFTLSPTLPNAFPKAKRN